MVHSRPLLALAFGALTFFSATQPRLAHATIVERVVAVVGERPILLSELRHRARPFLVRILSTSPSAAQQAAAETEMFRELLNRMIDDRLEMQAADKARLSVSSEEVDTALKNIAANAKVSISDLLAEAKRQGLSEQDYRDELRRQVLEGKLIQLRVRGRVHVTEQDARNSYGRWVKDLGDQAPAEVRILAIRMLPGSTEEALRAREILANEITTRAHNGEDFCSLVESYSDDISTKQTCGSRGPQSTSALIPTIQEAIRTMKEGEISPPIRYGNEAWLIIQLVQQPRIPEFESVKDLMTERAFAEAMEKQRKEWLQELRRTMYVEVRL